MLEKVGGDADLGSASVGEIGEGDEGWMIRGAVVVDSDPRVYRCMVDAGGAVYAVNVATP